ncbi:oxidoreductase [Mycena amicta]|nr:oxidoreductase [Mycena amicta]
MVFGRKSWNPDGRHVYVTGGSQGLGLAVAILLTRKGAHVSIVARDQEKLDTALKLMEEQRQHPNQKLAAYSFSLSTAKESAAALEAACAHHDGRAPDAVFACAGSSKPMFFLDMTEEDMANGMVQGYWVQAWTAVAAAKKMVRDGVNGKIVLVSSTLGYMSFVGYASYAPPKHALRGLADTLASEFMLYDIDVHIFFPPTMFTPGFDEENKTKPKLVLDIESVDDGLKPEVAAAALLQGVQKGEAHITADMITSLFRACTRGATPSNNVLLDVLYDILGWITGPFWRSSVAKRVRAHKEEHRQHLQERGFFA